MTASPAKVAANGLAFEGLAFGQVTYGRITVRICGTDMVEMTRAGEVGRLRSARQVIWGYADIQSAYAAAASRKDDDGRNQERALRWAMQHLQIPCGRKAGA